MMAVSPIGTSGFGMVVVNGLEARPLAAGQDDRSHGGLQSDHTV